MRILKMARGEGKTYRLITEAAQRNAYIVCKDRQEVERVFQMAMDRELNIPFPLTFSEFANKRWYGPGVREVMIDELDQFLHYLYETNISYCTYTPA